MRTKALTVVLLVCSGCIIKYEPEVLYFFGNDTAMTAGASTVNFTGNLEFQADLFLLMGVSRTYDLVKPFKEDVHPEGQGTYTVDAVEEVQLPARKPAAILVLMDQSGTYDSADAFNFRSKQVNQFLHDLGQGTNFLVGGYAKGGALVQEPVETALPSFTGDPGAVTKFLFGMTARTGGVSPLHDAVLDGIARLAAVSGPRTLVVLAHGPDGGSTATMDQVIAQAVANNVLIDMVYIGKAGDAQPLTRISAETGGLFSFCPTYLEMVTSFNHLNRIYTEGATLTRIRMTFTPSVLLTSGMDTFHSVTIHDPLGEIDYNPALVVVRIP